MWARTFIFRFLSSLTVLSLASALAVLSLASALALVLVGCGSKTALSTGPRRDGGATADGGLDASVDGGPDGGPDAGGGVVVACPRRDQYTTIRRALTLDASATSSAPIVTEGWSLVDRPSDATAENAPTTGPTTAITPDVVGDFLLRYTATDADGMSGACDVIVHSVVGPPIAICPEEDELTTLAGAPLVIMGDAFDDDGIAAVLWTLEGGPGMAAIDPPDMLVTTFFGGVVGTYMLRLTVTDIDGAMDSCVQNVRVIAPPDVLCPPSPIRAPTRQPLTLTARATDDTEIARVRWEMTSRPAGSTATVRPPDASTTRMTPDKQGNYQLTFTATDTDGLSASCMVTVIGTPTPPDATCPATVETTPLDTVTLMGSGVDDGRVVAYRWDLVSSPMGSAARPPTPRDGMVATFTPDIAGEYRIRLTVTDDDGETGTCEFLVRAVATEGIRVEMFWDTDGTDMDTHLLRPEGTSWFDDNDCYYANCNETSGAVLEWGAAGLDDNPRLDIDNTSGRGPENINIDRPYNGTYRVGIHAFRGNARVTVRIYCGGSDTMPRRTFGPVSLRGTGTSFQNDFWRVADVDISGASCRITDLSAADGRPNITRATDAQMRR